MLKVFNGVPRRRIVWDFINSCLWSFMNAAFSNSLAVLLTGLVNGRPLTCAIIFFTVYIILWELLELICDVHNAVTCAVLESGVNKYYFNQIYKIKPSVLKSYNTGYISGLLNKLVVRQEQAYNNIVLNMPISIVYVLYFTVVMWQKSWILGLLMLIVTVLGNILRLAVGSIGEKYSQELSTAEGIRNKSVVDFVSNINTVQKMRSVNFMNSVLDTNNDDCIKKAKKWSIFDEIAYCGCKLVIFTYTPIVLLLYGYIAKDIVNPQEFYMTLTAVAIQLVHNAKSFVRSISVYNKFKGTLIKMEDILKPENIRQDILEEDFMNLTVENLKFSYELKRPGDSKLVQVNIPEFSFKKGEKVCIFGESGQGKTTLLHLISGEIENDRTYINDNKTKKRLRCMFIAQDTEMFDMSLKDNLTLGRDIESDKIIKYLDAVGMGSWYDAQEKGLDTILGERGVFVSTGQRQRLNLIRGLLAHNDEEVFLLDEPTSNVDEEVEEMMIKLIKEVLHDKTVIIVTHRPKIKEICDKFYKFEKSTVFEVTKEEALNK